MANLSNINNKFLVTTTGEVLVSETGAAGAGKLWVKNDSSSYTRIANFYNTTDNSIPYITVGNQAAEGADSCVVFAFADSTTDANKFGWIGMAGDGVGTGIHWKRGGNVGIGTVSPGAKLDISNVTGGTYALEISTPERDRALFFYNSASVSDAGYLGIKRGSVDALNHRFATSGNSAVCIGEGNFGIGNDSPRDKLTIFTPGSAEEEIALRLVNPIGFTNAGSGSSIIFAQDRNTGENIPMAKIRNSQSAGGTSCCGELIFSTAHSSFGGMIDKIQISSNGATTFKGAERPQIYLNSRYDYPNNPTFEANTLAIVAAKYIGTAPYEANRIVASNSTHLAFEAGGAEIMRIDSSGNVGIGQDNPDWLLELKMDSSAGSAGNYPAIVVNNPNAGGYSAFYLFNGAQNLGGLEYNNSNNILSLYSYEGNAVSIPNGIFLGGTVAANKLDDYEEGTWTPVAFASASSLTATYSEQLGTYTKIGRQVICMFDFTVILSGTMSGFAGISGLPFTVGTSSATGGGMAGYSVNQFRSSTLFAASGAGRQISGFSQQNANYIYVQFDNSGVNGFGGSIPGAWNTGTVGRCTGYVIYFTD